MPSRDVGALLAQQPDIVYSVQKGKEQLGPGAEFW